MTKDYVYGDLCDDVIDRILLLNDKETVIALVDCIKDDEMLLTNALLKGNETAASVLFKITKLDKKEFWLSVIENRLNPSDYLNDLLERKCIICLSIILNMHNIPLPFITFR